MANGQCNQCNHGNQTAAEKKAFCSLERYAWCADNLLGHGQEQQGRGKHGFLIKYDHFSYAPLSPILEHLKAKGCGFIHVTRDPLFIWLSLQDRSYKNRHGGSYAQHAVNLKHYSSYHALYMGWATGWAAELKRLHIPTLELSYEELSGRHSWRSWNRFAAFLGAAPLQHDPVTAEAGAFSTPPCEARILNWAEVAAHHTVKGTRTAELCADPFSMTAAAADFLSSTGKPQSFSSFASSVAAPPERGEIETGSGGRETHLLSKTGESTSSGGLRDLLMQPHSGNPQKEDKKRFKSGNHSRQRRLSSSSSLASFSSASSILSSSVSISASKDQSSDLLTTRRLEVPESKRDRRQIKPSQAGQTSPRKEHTLVIDEVSDEEDPPLPPLSSSFEVSLITRTFAGRRMSVSFPSFSVHPALCDYSHVQKYPAMCWTRRALQTTP